LNDWKLERLFEQLTLKCILLLEDVDSASIQRENAKASNNEKKAGGVTLSGLLGVIDGLLAPEGRIVVMTTNHVNRLDEALIRAARIDLTVELGYASPAVAAGVFRKNCQGADAPSHASSAVASQSRDSIWKDPRRLRGYFGLASTKEASSEAKQTEADMIKAASDDSEMQQLAQPFASHIPEGKVTPAELQGFLLQFRGEASSAVSNVAGWVKKHYADETNKPDGLTASGPGSLGDAGKPFVARSVSRRQSDGGATVSGYRLETATSVGPTSPATGSSAT